MGFPWALVFQRLAITFKYPPDIILSLTLGQIYALGFGGGVDGETDQRIPVSSKYELDKILQTLDDFG